MFITNKFELNYVSIQKETAKDSNPYLCTYLYCVSVPGRAKNYINLATMRNFHLIEGEIVGVARARSCPWAGVPGYDHVEPCQQVDNMGCFWVLIKIQQLDPIAKMEPVNNRE